MQDPNRDQAPPTPVAAEIMIAVARSGGELHAAPSRMGKSSAPAGARFKR
jgi:hypothetical protein